MSNSKLIKLTSKGKVSIAISDSMKDVLIRFLEYIQHHNNHVPRIKIRNDTGEFITTEKMRLALVNEVYMRHHLMLSMINQDGRMLLTWAQALALFSYWLDYQADFSHPEMGNLFMQLHQKLS